MAVTSDYPLLSDDDLATTEVKLSGVVLKAGAFHLGKYCEDYNNEFMLCRKETEDPSQCLSEGRAVTNCTLDFFRMVKNSCADKFERYYKCIDKSSSSYEFYYCRNSQASFDKCMKDKNSLERPDFGYFSRVKIHKTERPKPPEDEPLVFNASDLPAKLPPDYPERNSANFGAREYFACI